MSHRYARRLRRSVRERPYGRYEAIHIRYYYRDYLVFSWTKNLSKSPHSSRGARLSTVLAPATAKDEGVTRNLIL